MCIGGIDSTKFLDCFFQKQEWWQSPPGHSTCLTSIKTWVPPIKHFKNSNWGVRLGGWLKHRGHLVLGKMQERELSWDNKRTGLKNTLAVSAHLSSEFVPNCQKMEAIQVAFNSWADEQTGSFTEVKPLGLYCSNTIESQIYYVSEKN